MKRVFSTLAALVTAALLSGTAQGSDNWEFMVEPYVLASMIEGDSELGPIGPVDLDVEFDTILDNLDKALMGHAEILHRSGWGLFLDYGLMDLKADTDTPGGGVLGAQVRQAVTQVALMYRMDFGQGESWDILLGGRHWNNDLRLDLQPGFDAIGRRRASKDADWTDAILGGRYTLPLSSRWHWMLYGDIGMGDADFTAALASSFDYVFNDTFQLEMGYKAIWVDYEEGRAGTRERFAYDTVTHGPVIGLKIRF